MTRLPNCFTLSLDVGAHSFTPKTLLIHEFLTCNVVLAGHTGGLPLLVSLIEATCDYSPTHA